MSVCTVVAYQIEMLFEKVAGENPLIDWVNLHVELVREDYLELKDTIVNFKDPF